MVWLTGFWLTPAGDASRLRNRWTMMEREQIECGCGLWECWNQGQARTTVRYWRLWIHCTESLSTVFDRKTKDVEGVIKREDERGETVENKRGGSRKERQAGLWWRWWWWGRRLKLKIKIWVVWTEDTIYLFIFLITRRDHHHHRGRSRDWKKLYLNIR